MQGKIRVAALARRFFARAKSGTVTKTCTVSDTHLTPLAGIRSNAVPLEVGELTCEGIDVDRRLGQHAPSQQLVEDAELKVSSEFGIDSRRRETIFLKFPESCRETGASRVAQFGERLSKSRINGMRLVQDDPRRVGMVHKELEPASKARFEDGAGAARSSLLCRRIERLECAFHLIVEVFEHREQDAFLAVEVQIERAAGHVRAGDDVGDAGPSIAFARKDPRRCLDQLQAAGISRQQSSSLMISKWTDASVYHVSH